jgi:para-nitrobenzyl esterase
MILGQSGGGRKVSLLTASPSAQGLFHRAVVQSGSHLRLMTRERANELAERLLRHFDLAQSDARKLQGIPWRELRRANRDIIRATSLRFAPSLDETTFAVHPWDPQAPPSAAAIPMLIGTTRTELSNQLGSSDESTFTLDEAGLSERLTSFVPPPDVSEIIALFKRSNPGASAPELYTGAPACLAGAVGARSIERNALPSVLAGGDALSYEELGFRARSCEKCTCGDARLPTAAMVRQRCMR